MRAAPGGGSAGITVTLTGSGFAAGDKATVDGISVALSVADEHTATLVTPAHANGAAVIEVTPPTGNSSSLDPGFLYGGAAQQPTPQSRSTFAPKHVATSANIGASPRSSFVLPRVRQ